MAPTPEETQQFADRKIVHLETWSGKIQRSGPVAQPGSSQVPAGKMSIFRDVSYDSALFLMVESLFAAKCNPF